MNAGLQVSIAPIIDLHTGYHGAMIDSAIAGVSIKPRHATHVFIHQANWNFSPHAHHHLGEFIQVEGHSGIVHSARWPVLGCSAWVVDADDLMYPVLCGRAAHNPKYRARIRDRSDDEMRKALRIRAELLTSCYAHPSCMGILLRGHPRDCVRDAKEWFEWIGAEVDDEFFRKIIPVRPAQQAMERSKFEEKWSEGNEVRVMFCGRDFDYKNGHLALRVMRPLLDAYSFVKFVYVGKISDEVLSDEPELLVGVEHHPKLDHKEVIAKLREAHVFFHPSKGDSIGISLLEAMGAGLAVVVARGGAMEYTDELFGAGGALMLDRDAIGVDDEQNEFRILLERLVTNYSLARTHASHNLMLTSVGEFSVEAQGAMLTEMYRRGLSSNAPSLSILDLCGSDEYSVTRMSSDDVWRDMRAFRESLEEGAGYKCILV